MDTLTSKLRALALAEPIYVVGMGASGHVTLDLLREAGYNAIGLDERLDERRIEKRNFDDPDAFAGAATNTPAPAPGGPLWKTPEGDSPSPVAGGRDRDSLRLTGRGLGPFARRGPRPRSRPRSAAFLRRSTPSWPPRQQRGCRWERPRMWYRHPWRCAGNRPAGAQAPAAPPARSRRTLSPTPRPG